MNPNTPHSPDLVQRSTTMRFIRWFFRPRTLGRILCALLTLVTVIALFYAEERWRGNRAWTRFADAQNAQGNRLDWESFIPPKVPDEQNFAACAALAPLLDFLPGTQTRRDTNAFQRMSKLSQQSMDEAKRLGFELDRRAYRGWQSGERANLSALLGSKVDRNKAAASDKSTTPEEVDPAKARRAAESLLAILKVTYDPVLEDLRMASQRRYSRFNIAYESRDLWSILLPHLAYVKSATEACAWRASAELTLGQVDRAYEDLVLASYLSDSVKEEPILISFLVRISCRAFTTQVVWEGISTHQWTDQQLQSVEALLANDDFPKQLVRSTSAERAAVVRTADQFRAGMDHPRLSDLGGPDTPLTGGVPDWLVPGGWFYFEELNYCLATERILQPLEEWRNGRLDSHSFFNQVTDVTRQIAEGEKNGTLLNHHLFERIFLPGWQGIILKSFYAQGRNDLTRTACALERWFLANGQYPEKLADLAPKFIAKVPLDLMSGRSLLYRRDQAKGFILYSLGGNFTDDGGRATSRGHTNDQMDRMRDEPGLEEGDWVWRQPTT